MLPVAIIPYAQYISLDKQVVPIEISVDIGITIGKIGHAHLIVHTFLQRRACQIFLIIAGINTIECSSYIKPT